MMDSVMKLLLIILLMICSFARAGSKCSDNGDGTITDEVGMIWQKCLLGQIYIKDNGGCSGAPEGLNWISAVDQVRSNNFLGKSDWRFPSARELHRRYAWYRDSDYGCENKFIEFKINYNKQIKITSNFWVLGVQDNIMVWDNDYYGGENRDIDPFSSKNLNSERYRDKYIGSVLTTLVRGDYKDPQYPVDPSDFKRLVLHRDRLVIDADNLAKEAARKQQEDIKKQNAAQADLKSILDSKNPQQMYLSAGIYERNGENYNATVVYEAIIRRFPDSKWAVKSSDQLNANKRANDSENSARQRVYDESNRCSARIRSCESSCFSLEGASYGACLKRCQSICSR